MPTEIRMPSLSAGAEDAKLLSWLRKEGDVVREGEEIAEVETDKATMAIEAPHDGTLGSILVPAGGPAVRVDSPIAILLRDGETAAVTPASPATSKAVSAINTPATLDAAHPIAGEPSHASTLQVSSQGRGRILASPLARRLAKDRRIDISTLDGTGPHGRIVRADVERTAAKDKSAPHPQLPSMPQETPAILPAPMQERADAILRTFAGRGFKEIRLDGMRRTIADRLTLSKQTVPHYCLRREIRVDALLDLRVEINERLAAAGVRLSVNDFFIKACALALQEVPDCNATWAGDRILQLEASDIAVAVSAEGGLYTPVLRDAHAKSVSTLSREMRQFVERARDHKLLQAECEGGSMTVSNLGMHGVENFDAIIIPPQSAILAVGANTRRMIFDAAIDTFVSASVMSITLSVDHRVVDGVLGARLLSAIARKIENPLSMMV